MYTGLVISNDKAICDECTSIAKKVEGIDLRFVSSFDELNSSPVYNYLFILISDLDQKLMVKLHEAQLQAPGLVTIFYNHSLNYPEFPELTLTSKVKMIIGENRKSNLIDLLKQLKDNFWRKIPYQKFGIDFDMLSPRMRKAMQFIETAPINKCNINSIAGHLDISAGYFSQEFKRETNKSFRTFMQNVINYYEEIIFSNVNLPAKNISQILGYSELSSFSRSFKKRKGISPTEYKKLVRI